MQRRPRLSVEDWPHRPVNCRFGTTLGGDVDMPDPECVPINNMEPTPFETDLFKGYVMLNLRNVDGETDPWGEGGRFHGKRRNVVLTIQGQFKKELPYTNVYCGLMWKKQLVNLPWGIMVKAAEGAIATLSPGAVSDIQAAEFPHFMNLLLAGVDTLDVRTDEDGPLDISNVIVTERSQWSTPKQRMGYSKKLRGKNADDENNVWKTDRQYTFDFYGDKVELTRFVAMVPTLSPFHLEKYFNGQPFPFVARTGDGEILWNFEIWNEIQFDDDDDLAQALAEQLEQPVGLPTEVSSQLSLQDSFPSTLTMGDTHSVPSSGAALVRDHSFVSCIPSETSELLPQQPSLRGHRWRSRLKLRGRWADWDVNKEESRPKEALCAIILLLCFIAMGALVSYWWHDELFKRVKRSITKEISTKEWLLSLAAAAAAIGVCSVVGAVTQFIKTSTKYGKAELMHVTAAALLSVPEEAVFRCAILPVHEDPDNKTMAMWMSLSVILFVFHFPLIASATSLGYPTLCDPRYLALSAVVGVACVAIYSLSESLWTASLTNAICSTVWLLLGGGSRRLRRVRIVLPSPTQSPTLYYR
eukprot:TRINITY_DN18281_c0_g2_i1.p1 TRINITY_DN18281_c0_g2~~TRINITY_DN18281_c0_g2_i1.p1  ORF type:complete len:584 (+),score=123.49 TRINITY_DN18281_c0_g2_i1:159-1910(+)